MKEYDVIKKTVFFVVRVAQIIAEVVAAPSVFRRSGLVNLVTHLFQCG